ncbi:MAG: hypothetical protein QGG36_19250 [Pirellulaceae bacterium]|jgi:hypothetical protein|nr:hypothetical protein [Pirellulaceae bacterium]
MEIYEEIIKERPEFAFETNLSRKLEPAPTALSQSVVGAHNGFSQHGLAWMTALARVEMGSILAGFSEIQRPYRTVSPTPFDAQPYHALLLDGARVHYWALVRDTRLPWVMRQDLKYVDKAVLSYSRRLVLGRGMLRTAGEIAGPNYTPDQQRETEQWRRTMDEVQAVLVLKVRSVLGSRFVSASGSRDTEYTRACSALLDAERRETAAGTARVESLK